MKDSTLCKVDYLIECYPDLKVCREDLVCAVDILCESFRSGNKLITCGNGGSASDSQHIVGELMKSFILSRSIDKFDKEFHNQLNKTYPNDAEYLTKNLQCALPAISLIGETALTTAFANDQSADLIFAQQVYGIGQRGDVLLAITTSGNSTNVLYAVKVAKSKGIKTIALTGESGGKIKDLADVTIKVPSNETYRIQEYHLPIYHMLCIAVENEFFG